MAADWTVDGVDYTALKSIKGANSGYVVTGITPLCTDIVKMKFQPVAAVGALFCARNASASGMFTCYHSSTDGSIRIDRGAVSSSNQKTSNSKVLTGNDYLLTADYGKKTATIVLSGGGVDLFGKALGGADTYTVGSTLVLFAMHSNLKNYSSFGTDYIYYFELYDSSGNLKHCLLPAQRNTDSVYGFYDTRTGTFYPQSGGTFTAAERTVTVTGNCKKWIGRGADNKMSTPENWEGGVAPGDGDNLDFTLAAPLAEINADISGVTFGKLWIDDGDIPSFTGSLAVSSCNDSRARAMPAIILPADDYIWNGGAAENWNTAGAWSFDNAAVTWADNNNAIFNTANATATLTANAEANSLAFNADATIDGSATITVPAVSVDSGVSATISAPTAGALAKIGAGTLTLTENRTDAATTLSEGTLALSGTASLDWTKFTFGTDPAKPVMLDFGPRATLSGIGASAACKIGGVANVTSTVHKAGGDWEFHDFILGNASGAVTTFLNDGGNLMAKDYFRIGDRGSATFVVSGGTVGSSSSDSKRVFVGYTGEGTLVVTNGGVFSANQSLFVARSANGTINVADRGCVHAGADIVFNYNNTDGRGVVNLGRGGVVEAKRAYRSNVGSSSFNFDGGTFRRLAAGDFFAANNDAAAIDVTVSANGGTLDNNGFAVGLPRTITGAGGMTLSGSGTTTVSADQSYKGTTTVSNETTLSVSGGVTFAGPVVFNEDSALDIAGYNGTTPLSATAITFPDEGTVALTLDSGAFDTGVYKICATDDLTAADGEKFSIDTGDKSHMWSIHDNTLILLVGEVDANAWTGLAGDGKMSSAANWAGYAVPAAGEDIDLSGISADTTIIADAGRTFGAVTMGSGVITFTNSFAATSFSDTSKVAVGADSTVTLVGDLVFATNVTACVCYSIASGGMFAVTGDIIASAEHTAYVVPCIGQYSIPGTISCKGIVNNCGSSGDRFYLVRGNSNTLANWLVGEDGISGSKRFLIGDYNNSHANISARTNFTVSADIVQQCNLTLDTAGYEINLGTDTSAKSGGILGGSANGLTTVTGTGRVIVNYNVNDLSSLASSRTNAFTVATGATLALNPSANIGFGDVTVQSGGTLEIQSGTTTFGNLTVAENAILSFNFTDRRNAPVLALYDGAEVTAQDPFTVKVSGTVWPLSGEKLLTTCGGFDGIPLTLSAAGNAARWAKPDRLSVNGDYNIVLDIKPMGTRVIVR